MVSFTLTVAAPVIGIIDAYGTASTGCRYGRSRRDDLSERVQAIVLAIHALTRSIRETINCGRAISDKELILFCRIGVTPLIEEVQRLLDKGELAGMKVHNRARLWGHLINLQTLLSKLDAK